jgi:hypothetical protein
LVASGLADRARAAFVVAPNAYTNAEAPVETIYPFRGANDPSALQWILPAANFAAVAPGSLFTGIGFRLNASSAGVTTAVNFAEWNLQLSTAINPALSLSTTLATNIGADVVTVRSGPLSIPANAFPTGPSPPGFYAIPFTTPFAYNGGELVVTLRHTGHPGSHELVSNDAVAAGALGNTVGGSFTSTTGTVNFFNFPVARFTVTPEPQCLVLLAIGLLAMTSFRRRVI